MSRHNRHGGRQRSRGGSAGGGAGGPRAGKLSYDSGEEPAFIRQFKERTGYKAPATTEDKHRMDPVQVEKRAGDGDYRRDDERPQIVQLNPTDLSKEEVELEIDRQKQADEERKCTDPTGRLLFRKPREKSPSDQTETTATSKANKNEIIEIASNKTMKRKVTSSQSTSNSNETKKTKSQLLSFMNESGMDGDDN